MQRVASDGSFRGVTIATRYWPREDVLSEYPSRYQPDPLAVRMSIYADFYRLGVWSDELADSARHVADEWGRVPPAGNLNGIQCIHPRVCHRHSKTR